MERGLALSASRDGASYPPLFFVLAHLKQNLNMTHKNLESPQFPKDLIMPVSPVINLPSSSVGPLAFSFSHSRLTTGSRVCLSVRLPEVPAAVGPRLLRRPKDQYFDPFSLRL